MRFRIVHQLSLLMVGSVLLAVVAIGGVVVWNLKAGFSDYLRARDTQQLERFALVVAERATGLIDAQPEGEGAPVLPMRELMDEFLHREGLTPPPNWRPARAPQGERPRPPPPPRRADPPPPRAEAPAPVRPGAVGPDGLSQRIQVVDPQGRHLGGPRFPAGRQLLTQDVQVNGQLVAYARMLPSTEVAGVDARFLRRQYTGLALAAAGSLAVALLAAWLAARWLGGPLRTVQAATRRIAEGELDLVMAEQGSREMADLIADVNRMAGALKQLEGARRSWIAQISHELRTPLSVLLGELESIQDGARQPTPTVVANLRGEVLHLVRLVGDLHTLSMADLGALPCEFSDGDAASTLQTVLQRFAPRLAQAGLTLAVQAGPAVRVHWDFGRITQLMTNLLENSLRYTTAPGQVRVQWAVTPQAVVLRVDDSLPGLTPAQLPLVFDPLFRADTARQRHSHERGGGSGLGLAICRAIVLAHGGQISAHASDLGGVCIAVSLPLNLDLA